jgi:sugar lactone lactonase YvrE
VYLWTAAKGFGELPGSRFSGDNGLLASHDGQWLFVNSYGTKEVYRVPVSGKGASSSVKVDFHPDNLRWAPDGKIFVTGHFIIPENANSLHGWGTARLDPQKMTAVTIVKEPGLPVFDNATSTVQIGKTLWFGTYSGDRVAYRPAP